MTDHGAPWWKAGAIYQIYPRSYMDASGDGIGDLAGICRQLDHVAGLGATAIWTSPIYPSPMADFGYDVADYTDIDPVFGTLADFDRMLARAHELHLAVVIDWVPNHSSSQHPWFVESRSSRDSPKRDWYVWRDPAPGGGPPNNWQSVFGGSAWHYDPSTGQYYLHSFLPEQPDLNWRNPEVETAMLDTLRFWLDRGVDGFRIDVAHFLMKDPEMRDNPLLDHPAPGYKTMGVDYDRQEHRYDKGHPDIHGVFRRIRSLLDAYEAADGRPRYSVGEIHISDWEEWASYYGNDDELHMPYNFALVNGPWTGPWVRDVIRSVEAAVPPNGWPNYVLGNHDEPRIASRLGWNRSLLASLMLIMLRGTPTIYYGDEIGMLQAEIPPEDQHDPWGRRVPGMGRDGCRTPMQWDSSPNAGFCPAGVKPWLPIVDPDGLHNVAAQEGDPSSRLERFRSFLAARNTSPAIQTGRLDLLDELPDQLVGFKRSDGDQQVVVLLNFGETAVEVDVAGHVLTGTDHQRSGHLAGPLMLEPWEGLVLRQS